MDTTGVGYDISDLTLFDDGRIDPREWFDDGRRTLPFEIEIGSGKGTFLIQQAALQPQVNYLGIEWARGFYRYAADRVRRHQLKNVKLLRADAMEFIRYSLSDSICRVIHLYFPDPWPKKRHHKRRMIQDRSLADLRRVLVPGGEVRIVTDHDDYWRWIEEHAERNTHLFSRRHFTPPESAGDSELVGSNFERKYRRDGRPFYALALIAISTDKADLLAAKPVGQAKQK